jgi:cation diffusion facilitator family transporter
MTQAHPIENPGTCGCGSAARTTPKRILIIALVLNALMFVVGLTAGVLAHSTGLIADALDMLADALAYGLGLAALNRSGLFQSRSATVRGVVLVALGLLVCAEAVRRLIVGSAPDGAAMIGIPVISLLVNGTVLLLLSRHQRDNVNMRASYICTRADVIANIGVIVSGIAVTITGSRFPDLIAGVTIGLYVVKEGLEIMREAHSALPHPVPDEP